MIDEEGFGRQHFHDLDVDAITAGGFGAVLRHDLLDDVTSVEGQNVGVRAEETREIGGTGVSVLEDCVVLHQCRNAVQTCDGCGQDGGVLL